MHKEAAIREPLVLGNDVTYSKITKDVLYSIEHGPTKLWKVLMTIATITALWGVGCILYLLGTGIGTWGLNNTMGWAWDITNFVWWVGIGHAGTLISAVLLLFRQKWRMAINRPAEAMTIFAVFMAGTFPMIHMGRIWMAYWVFPLPNQFGSLWVNFNSPLLWDVFAISTYMSVSLVFWYIGLIPDFATIRDRASRPVQKLMYSLLSFGWTGNAKAWQRFEEVSLVLAGLATPLVFSVHSIVSMDFATSIVPGWHSTIFPPYFVAGAVFSGFAMVQTLMLIARKAMRLEYIITVKHIEYMNIVIIVTGGIVGVAYVTEFFIGWYTGVKYESYVYMSAGAATGPYAWAFWSLIFCNFINPAFLWFKKIRTSLTATFIIALIINIGMWFERFDIIVTCLSRDYLPSTWRMFFPTWVDLGVYIGTIGIFSVFYLLFLKYFPVLALNEVKTILKSSGERYKNMSDEEFKQLHPVFKKDIKGYSEPAPVAKKVEKIEKVEVPVEKKEVSLEAAPVKTASTKDDLTKIEGIGPKIQEHLQNGGIFSFADLAATSVERLQEILDNAGPRYRMHKPGTWPDQSKLAAEGKWEELKKWQDELDGGK